MRQLGPIGTATIITLALFVAIPSVAAAQTSKVSGEFYEVTVKTSKAQGKQAVRITTTGKGGYKCNDKYPWKVTIEPASNGSDKIVLKKKDAKKLTKEEVVFETSTVPAEGKKSVAKLKLSTCNDKQCKMATVDLSW